MDKDFKILAEAIQQRFEQGGLVQGDFVKFKNNVLQNDKVRSRAKSYTEMIAQMGKGDLNLRIAAIKPVRATKGSADTTEFLADVGAEDAPGLFKQVVTVPLETLELVKQYDEWPDIPEGWKYKAPSGSEAGPAPEMTMAQDSHRQLRHESTHRRTRSSQQPIFEAMRSVSDIKANVIQHWTPKDFPGAKFFPGDPVRLKKLTRTTHETKRASELADDGTVGYIVAVTVGPNGKMSRDAFKDRPSYSWRRKGRLAAATSSDPSKWDHLINATAETGRYQARYYIEFPDEIIGTFSQYIEPAEDEEQLDDYPRDAWKDSFGMRGEAHDQEPSEEEEVLKEQAPRSAAQEDVVAQFYGFV